jgi:hypothetical protein
VVSTSGLSDGVRGSDAGPSDARAGDGGAVDATTDDAGAVDAGDRYAAEVLADNPAAYLRLDDGAGLVAVNRVAGGPAGTYVGAVGLQAPGALANGNRAVELKNDAWIDWGDVFPFAGAAPYTLEAWIRPRVVDSTRFVFDRGPSGGSVPGEGYTVYFGNGYLLAARSRAAGGEFGYVSTGASPATDVWTHVVVTYDGASDRFYAGGVLVDAASAGPIGTSVPGRLAIGNLARGQFNKFVGFVDEVAIYDHALTAARIAAHFAAAK